LKSKIIAAVAIAPRHYARRVPLSALLLALAAAFVHAFWNVLLARARDPEAATAVALVVSVIVFAPVAIVVGHVERAVWPYIAVTSCLQLVYFVALIAAYRRAELSVVYPVARGVAPVLVLVAGVVLLGNATSWTQTVGVVVVAGGVLLIRGLHVRGDWLGVGFGLGIAAVIATYTLVDKDGIRYASAIAYLELSMLMPAAAYAGGVLVLRGRDAVRAELRPASAVAGIATFTAYALVLAALRLAPAASVAAVRETSVLIATVLAALVLHERVTGWRYAGAALVAGGIALLSL